MQLVLTDIYSTTLDRQFVICNAGTPPASVRTPECGIHLRRRPVTCHTCSSRYQHAVDISLSSHVDVFSFFRTGCNSTNAWTQGCRINLCGQHAASRAAPTTHISNSTPCLPSNMLWLTEMASPSNPTSSGVREKTIGVVCGSLSSRAKDTSTMSPRSRGLSGRAVCDKAWTNREQLLSRTATQNKSERNRGEPVRSTDQSCHDQTMREPGWT